MMSSLKQLDCNRNMFRYPLVKMAALVSVQNTEILISVFAEIRALCECLAAFPSRS